MTGADANEWSGFEIAVVGLAGRFPGAADVASFWANLRDGVESIKTLTDEELLAAGEDPALLADPAYVRAAAVLDGVDQFDAAFFGVTPREAELMDPQHRLFLEYAWAALEDAGYDAARVPGPVGVFGGTGGYGYLIKNLVSSGATEFGGLPLMFGNGNDYLSSRVSYKLDLKGPAFNVQTGCSSSLVAVHLASQALLSGECDMALAGGVGIALPQGVGYLHQAQGIYSPDGHCRAFSNRAEGTVGGSGVALVVLRRLADALEDGDTIRAVIKGSAINNDGANKVGYAAPSVEGQSQVIRSALAMADVQADTMGYVEAHGTGTTLGDPIEVAALTAAYRSQTEAKGFCAIGSLKTNVGHLDAAAGVAGLIKVSLALEAKQIPPSLNCEEPDPAIDFPSTPFRVNTELLDWHSDGPRRGAVSSFGIGGTNAHVILQEAPRPKAADDQDAGPQLIVLSARTAKALDQAGANLREQLLQAGTAATDASQSRAPGAELSLADVAWTLQVGRHDFAHRRVLVVRDREDLCQALDALDKQRVRQLVEERQDRPVVFQFPGQGAQYARMGHELYEAEPTFRASVDEAAETLVEHLGLDLRTVLFPDADDEQALAAATEQLQQTWLTQPALFVIEHALARLLISWGVEPEAMIGHSIGEYVAAVLAGVFDLDGALALVAARGRLMQDLPEGDMLAVPLPAEDLAGRLGDQLSIAAINEPGATVISGPAEAVGALTEQLRSEGVATRELRTSHAFHSAMMDPILEAFAERVAQASPRAPSRPFISTLSGTWISDSEATDPCYWARHLRGTVRFADGAAELLQDGSRVFLEVGPGNTLSTLATRIARCTADAREGECQPVFAAAMRHPRETLADRECLLGAVGQLWLARVSIDWAALHGGRRRTRVPLPSYPFQRQRFWVEPGSGGALASRGGKLPQVSDWFSEASWMRAARRQGSEVTWDADSILVCASEGALADELIGRLTALGKTVSLASPGESFSNPVEGRFILRPGHRRDHDQLLAALCDQQRRPQVVLQLWSLDLPDAICDGTAPAVSEQALERGFFSLLVLAQALNAVAPGEPVTVLAGTRHALDVLGGEPLCPELATVLGACQSITQELAGLSFAMVDVGDAVLSGTRIDELLAELAQGCSEGCQALAWRGAHRWIPAYRSVSLPEEAGSPLRQGGHYLVIGGLGSIGLEVATCLATAGAVQLLLTGRSGFLAEEQWDGWLAQHDAADPTSLRIERLRRLAEMGAEVNIQRADGCDVAAMKDVIVAAEAAHGPLHGVVHAAGAEKAMIYLADLSRDDIEAQFRPKMAGLLALEQVLEGKDLDFCVVQSSLASVMGVLGLTGYVAAHHFVDAFVARHNSRGGTPWTSANWDNWLTWKEPEFLHAEGQDAYYMTPEEGASAFAALLSMRPGSQLIVSTGDVATRVAAWSQRGEGDGAEAGAAAEHLHERPDLGSDYEAPTTPAERALVAAWGEVLGIGEIGIHDSFFELGGDSVLGLQIVSQLARAGFKITPAQIFEHPTIAALAAVARSSSGPGADQGRVRGEAPLLPVQQRFFESDVPNPAHYNLPMLFELGPGDGPELLAPRVSQALEDVVGWHDALRLRFIERDGVRLQIHDEQAGAPELVLVDLSQLPAEELDAAMIERATELHQGFDLASGPLMAAALFHFGEERPPELLWIVHHLIVDVVSWRVIVEDLQTALEARARGVAPRLPPKTTSYAGWGEALSEHAGAPITEAELNHWKALGQASVGTLGVDSTEGDNDYQSTATVSCELDEGLTRSLIQDVNSAYETRIDEVLLTALARGVAAARGVDSLLVDLEGHGREDILEGVDLSRTVGWFTTIYPALLSLKSADGDGPGPALMAIKEQLRAIPRHGIGHGMLRWMHRDAAVRESLAALPEPELSFLYLGQFNTRAQGDSAPKMRLLAEVSGKPCAPDTPRGHLLELVGFVSGGRLRLELAYSSHRHGVQSARGLLEAIREQLVALIEHCLDPDAGALTPSDFPGAKVSQASLDKLLSRLGKGGKGAKR